jgi:hypothetical protein
MPTKHKLTMTTKSSLLRTVVVSILIIHPLLISSHTLLRKRSDSRLTASNDDSKDQHHDDDQYVSTKILTKLLPSNSNPPSSTTLASPMACIPQENALKRCYESLSDSFNVVKCVQCIYGNVNPGTQVITCPHEDNNGGSGGYCSSVAGCIEGTCPKDCEDEFYEVLNCIWGEAKCVVGSGGGKCVESKKKAVATDPYPSRSGTAATTTTTTTTAASAAATSSNPCSECSTSTGGVRNNFCGNLNTSPSQDVCSTQTECKDHGLKCQVCTEIVMSDGYGGKSLVENVGSGAYICVKEEEGDNKAAGGRGSSASSNAKKEKKQKGTAATNTSSTTTGENEPKGATTTTSSSSSATPPPPPAGGFCNSRAVVLGDCIYSKDASPDCINCVKAGTIEKTSDPTCTEVKQHQFCANIATCAHEHCGTCKFEFYAGLNCALQKISGCEQFSCAIGGGEIESESLSSSGEHADDDDDDDGKYTLQQFQDEVERQYTTMPPRVKELVVIRES